MDPGTQSALSRPLDLELVAAIKGAACDWAARGWGSSDNRDKEPR